MSDTSPKAALRARLRALRPVLAAEQPLAAERAAQILPIGRLPDFAVAAGYRPVGSEIDPAPVLRRLAAAGARTALPRADRADAALSFRLWTPGEPLEPDAFRIPSPLADAAGADPDLILAPLLAFDRRGGRLGQGAGHYDRTLEALRRHRAVFVLGLAYAGQEVDEIPMQPHDQRLDAILTETAYIEVG